MRVPPERKAQGRCGLQRTICGAKSFTECIASLHLQSCVCNSTLSLFALHQLTLQLKTLALHLSCAVFALAFVFRLDSVKQATTLLFKFDFGLLEWLEGKGTL